MGTGSLQRGPERSGSWTKQAQKIQVWVLTIGSYPVVFGFVVFFTAVFSRLEMVRAVRICTMLAFEG